MLGRINSIISKSFRNNVYIQLCTYLCCSTVAHALLHLSVGNKSYTRAPAFNELPFDSVAQICNQHGRATSGSAVYIKGSYLLTANHVKIRSHVTFDNQRFYKIDKSFKPRKIANADLKLFRVIQAPKLASTTLFDKPHGDTDITGWIIGWGLGNANNSKLDTVTPEQTKEIIHKWGPKHTIQKRWGTNHINRFSTWTSGARPKLTTSPCSQASASEAALTTYDSGGALFVYNNSKWKLAGIATHASSIGSSVFGGSASKSSRNYYERIYYYREEIESLIENSLREEISITPESPIIQDLLALLTITVAGFAIFAFTRKRKMGPQT